MDKLITLLTSNLGTKLISVMIAMVLWIVVLGSRNVEVTKEVPLEVVTASDVVSSNEVPEKIAFRLSGPKAFLRAILDRREEPIRVNLAGVKPGLITYRFFSDNIHVPIGVKVLSIHPTAIVIKLEQLKRRDVPIRMEVRGSPAEGYKVLHTEVRPGVVKLKGPETQIDGITEVQTKPIDVAGMKQSLEREVALQIPQHDVQVDGAFPKAHIEIVPTSANFRIRNVDVRVLSFFQYTVVEKSVTVFVRASADELKSLDRTQVYGVVDLRGKPKGRYLESLKVTLPENIGLVKVVPEKVKVTLY